MECLPLISINTNSKFEVIYKNADFEKWQVKIRITENAKNKTKQKTKQNKTKQNKTKRTQNTSLKSNFSFFINKVIID